jgi:hypothetical protein
MQWKNGISKIIIFFQANFFALLRSLWIINSEKETKNKEISTRVDLSAKIQSATSFGSHMLLSFEGKRRGFGGPICTKQIKNK